MKATAVTKSKTEHDRHSGILATQARMRRIRREMPMYDAQPPEIRALVNEVFSIGLARRLYKIGVRTPEQAVSWLNRQP